MDVYRTEEEQVAAMQQWWRENGTRVLIAVVLAVASYAGWKWWQVTQQEKAAQAAVLYQGMMKSLQELTEGGDAAKDAGVRMQKAGEALITDHAGSSYAQYAALMLAASAVEADDYAKAEKFLRTALEANGGEGMNAIITERLARVVSAQGRHDEALSLLAGEVPATLQSGRENTRGDILAAAGKRAEARAAWEKAKAAAGKDDPLLQLLAMKLDYVAGE